jgi:hypothetical protein
MKGKNKVLYDILGKSYTSRCRYFFEIFKHYGFDLNERVSGTQNTPLIEAIHSSTTEEGLALFIEKIYNEFKGTKKAIDFNLKNNQKQSAAW